VFTGATKGDGKCFFNAIDMARSGVYADHTAVLVMAQVLERDICIMTISRDGGDACLTWIEGTPGFSGKPFSGRTITRA
jgi:hypothetical protein